MLHACLQRTVHSGCVYRSVAPWGTMKDTANLDHIICKWACPKAAEYWSGGCQKKRMPCAARIYFFGRALASSGRLRTRSKTPNTHLTDRRVPARGKHHQSRAVHADAARGVGEDDLLDVDRVVRATRWALDQDAAVGTALAPSPCPARVAMVRRGGVRLGSDAALDGTAATDWHLVVDERELELQVATATLELSVAVRVARAAPVTRGDV